MKRKLPRGIVVGILGTSAMTAVQEMPGSSESADGGEPSWENAPAPARVARKGLRLLGHACVHVGVTAAAAAT